MTRFAFPAPAATTLPIVGETSVFPVRRIVCVGRNYAAHRREMGGDDRDPPFFFAKPADAAVDVNGDVGAKAAVVAYPSQTQDLHHEIELVVALGGGGAEIAPDKALDLIFGYAVGVDLTRRDLQSAARGKGQPWDAAKGFDQSAPLSPIRRWVGPPPSGAIRLWVNGGLKQEALVSDMIWSVAEIIAEASKLWRLQPGDLIFTGTPEGVGPLARGDRVTGEVAGVGSLAFSIGA